MIPKIVWNAFKAHVIILQWYIGIQGNIYVVNFIFSTYLRLLHDPRDVLWVVAVDGGPLAAEGVLFAPEEHSHVLNAVLGHSRGVRDGAEGKVDLDILKQLHHPWISILSLPNLTVSCTFFSAGR